MNAHFEGHAGEILSKYGAQSEKEAFAEALSDVSGNRLSEEIKRIAKGW